MLRTTKKEMVFFDDFVKIIDIITEASKKFEKTIADFNNLEAGMAEISRLEHVCDGLVHATYERVHASFITPIDREDIYSIAKALDEILDQLEETTHRFYVYNVKSVKPPVAQFVSLIMQSVANLKTLVNLMPSKKALKEIHDLIVIVNQFENQGDTLYRTEMAKLYREEKDAIQVIAWTGIYDSLENTLDACEDVANIIEGIVMKNA